MSGKRKRAFTSCNPSCRCNTIGYPWNDPLKHPVQMLVNTKNCNWFSSGNPPFASIVLCLFLINYELVPINPSPGYDHHKEEESKHRTLLYISYHGSQNDSHISHHYKLMSVSQIGRNKIQSNSPTTILHRTGANLSRISKYYPPLQQWTSSPQPCHVRV